jgi:cytosine deaminase
MDFDLLLREVRLPNSAPDAPAMDIGVSKGRIAAIAPQLGGAAAEVVQGGGRIVGPGFVETHIHLDKTCILDRCGCGTQRFPHGAMERVSAVKPTFTVEDVTERASRTLEKCISHGCTRMRSHVEVDPKLGMRAIEGIKALIERYKWAIDLEICVMPQEGLTNYPGTDELMVAALKNGASVVGAAPSYDSDPAAQIHRVFEMAREFDVDIDMHLDSGASADHLDLWLVCDLAEKYGYGGRVTIGHVSKLSTIPPAEVLKAAKRLRDAGVALTVLPATDLYLGGRHKDHNVPRSVADANALMDAGVLCNIASNNILNPFTPLGDGQMIRMANLYANIIQRGSDREIAAIWEMAGGNGAKILRQEDFGVAVGKPADLVVLDAVSEIEAIRTIAPVLHVFKGGRRTVTRAPAVLHR